MNVTLSVLSIEEDLTYKAFGYKLTDLSPGSHKPVMARCEFCRLPFKTRLMNLRRNPKAAACAKCRGTVRAYSAGSLTSDKHQFWLSRQPIIDLTRIDLEATQKAYGQGQIDLSMKNKQRVVAICEFCNSPFHTSLISLHKSQKHVCCYSCSGIAAQFGRQTNVVSKNDFYKLWMNKRSHGFNKSDSRIDTICEFCLRPVSKQLRYISHKHVACGACSGTANAFHKQNIIHDKHQFWCSMHPQVDLPDAAVQATISRFGYDPRQLTAGSVKKIMVPCCFCSSLTEAKFHYWVKKQYRVSCLECRHRKNAETIMQRYGVSSVLEIPTVREKLNDPLTERIVASVLKDKYAVEFIKHYEIPFADGRAYSFDFYVPSCNLLIECQGDYFHDFKKNGYSGTPKDRAKSAFIENNTNFKLIWIWEHEIHMGRVRKILDFHVHGTLEPEVSIVDLSNLKFESISNEKAHGFLSQYHYLGNLGIAATCYGAFFEGQLISVCAFGGTTRQNTRTKVKTLTGKAFGPKQLKELRRFCIRPNVKAKRMASFAIRQFVKIYRFEHPEVKAIVSFADATVEDRGSIYKYAGWHELAKTGKSYHYMDPETFRMIHKKTVWNLATAAHMSESSFVQQSRLVKVAESEKYAWIKMWDDTR